MESGLRASSLVTLPMYDWPELNATTDLLWSRMQAALAAAGFVLPDTLDRHTPDHGWTDTRLALSQTCGFPLTTRLAKHVELLLTPMYAVEHFEQGYYRSPILVRRNDSRDSLTAFRGSRVVINSADSQSGFNTLRNLLLQRRLLTPQDAFFIALHVSGSHRESIRHVAEGWADLCAVDPVSWALAQRYTSFAAELRILDASDWSPALPLVVSRRWLARHTSSSLWRELIAQSIASAIDGAITHKLFLQGSVSIDWVHYQSVARVDCDIATFS